ncbi:MAG: purine-nucleoside phosphorylase, partial [Bdellovibrionales bacterium]|nr:purine-nucleoside phosphorylase [Bdellovibrionales bacterium]
MSNANKYISQKWSGTPTIGIVLGSGLGDFVNQIEISASVEFKDIPGFLAPTVEGHGGKLILGKLHGKDVVAMQGRVHFYEGHSLTDVVFPIRVLCSLGIETLILTNSAGGMLEGMKPADLMVIEDHINMTGHNPLIGPNDENLGPRFPDMTETYDRGLVEKLISHMKNLNITPHRGVYCW